MEGWLLEAAGCGGELEAELASAVAPLQPGPKPAARVIRDSTGIPTSLQLWHSSPWCKETGSYRDPQDLQDPVLLFVYLSFTLFQTHARHSPASGPLHCSSWMSFPRHSNGFSLLLLEDFVQIISVESPLNPSYQYYNRTP